MAAFKKSLSKGCSRAKSTSLEDIVEKGTGSIDTFEPGVSQTAVVIQAYRSVKIALLD